MTMFLLNILLAVMWMFLWGAFDIYSLVAGFVLGYMLLGVISRSMPGHSYGGKVWQLLSFLGYFVRILIKSNLIVAKEILTPGFSMKPRMVRYNVEGLTPIQLTTLANTISLTPGTLSADLSEDQKYLYIHCMYAEDREQAIKELDELRDRLMKEVFA